MPEPGNRTRFKGDKVFGCHRRPRPHPKPFSLKTATGPATIVLRRPHGHRPSSRRPRPSVHSKSSLYMAEDTSRSRNKRLRIEPRRSNRWSRRCGPFCSFCEEVVLRPMVVNRCPICKVWLHTDCLREHCLLHHPGVHVKGCEWGPREHQPGQAAGDAPLGEWGPREQAEWNQRVRGIDYYLMCGEQDGPDSDMIAEMSWRN